MYMGGKSQAGRRCFITKFPYRISVHSDSILLGRHASKLLIVHSEGISLIQVLDIPECLRLQELTDRDRVRLRMPVAIRALRLGDDGGPRYPFSSQKICALSRDEILARAAFNKGDEAMLAGPGYILFHLESDQSGHRELLDRCRTGSSDRHLVLDVDSIAILMLHPVVYRDQQVGDALVEIQSIAGRLMTVLAYRRNIFRDFHFISKDLGR